MSSPGSTSTRDVNSLLHNLRGEHFRHSLNVQRSWRKRVFPSREHDLPGRAVNLSYSDEEVPAALASSRSARSSISAAGPDPPKSWTVASSRKQEIDTDSQEWRAMALSVAYSHMAPDSNQAPSYLLPDKSQVNVPPLTLLCLRVLSSDSSISEFTEQVIPCIPHHLRRHFLRFAAVHCPPPNAVLYSLCEPYDHCDGEFIIVGPRATLRKDHFSNKRTHPGTVDLEEMIGENIEEAEEELSWDSPAAQDIHVSSPLHSLIILSTYLSVSTFLALPPTVTHLALMNLPSSVPLHRLPGISPLLVFLDLSFNKWLAHANGGAKLLQMVGWTRWTRLQVLVLRGYQLDGEVLTSVNRGRWDDVLIMQ